MDGLRVPECALSWLLCSTYVLNGYPIYIRYVFMYACMYAREIDNYLHVAKKRKRDG